MRELLQLLLLVVVLMSNFDTISAQGSSKYNWGQWTSCSKSCGNGTRSRNMTCRVASNACGSPPSNTYEEQACSISSCPSSAQAATTSPAPGSADSTITAEPTTAEAVPTTAEQGTTGTPRATLTEELITGATSQLYGSAATIFTAASTSTTEQHATETTTTATATTTVTPTRGLITEAKSSQELESSATTMESTEQQQETEPTTPTTPTTNIYPEEKYIPLEISIEREFTPSMNNKSSADFNRIKADVEKECSIVLESEVPGFLRIVLESIREGSIICSTSVYVSARLRSGSQHIQSAMITAQRRGALRRLGVSRINGKTVKVTSGDEGDGGIPTYVYLMIAAGALAVVGASALLILKFRAKSKIKTKRERIAMQTTKRIDDRNKEETSTQTIYENPGGI